VKRLDEIVVGAQFHRFHRPIHHVIGAHHHHDARGIGSLDLAQNLYAIHPGQHDVEQYEIGFFSSPKICSASSPEAAVRISKPSAVSPRPIVHSVKSSSSTIKTE
jgi:hypothetical protein